MALVCQLPWVEMIMQYICPIFPYDCPVSYNRHEIGGIGAPKPDDVIPC